MSPSVPSRKSAESSPVESSPAESLEPSTAEEAPADDIAATTTGDDTEIPLNRAARRAKEQKAQPSHVGPRGDQERQVRGARAHTKRSR